MYTIQPKKMLIINILDILKKYTDEDHRLSQRDICELLEKEYQMKVDRKAIKRNLMNLLDFGYDINFSESIRVNKKGEEEILYSDWYIERNFSDPELRLLIDSLLFTKHIPYSQCEELIEKLENLSNVYFRSRVKHIVKLPKSFPNNKQLFYTIEVLDEAISKRKQVVFSYGAYEVDKKLHCRKNKNGDVLEYVINPYQIVATNGRYYLIANCNCYDNVSHYRLDRIVDIKLLDTTAKPQKEIRELEHGLDLPKHMAEHIYMFAGESVKATFNAPKFLMNDIVDWFGKDFTCSNETEETIDITVQVNEKAMYKWSIQYSEYIEVKAPESLRIQLKEAATKIGKKYQ